MTLTQLVPQVWLAVITLSWEKSPNSRFWPDKEAAPAKKLKVMKMVLLVGLLFWKPKWKYLKLGAVVANSPA